MSWYRSRRGLLALLGLVLVILFLTRPGVGRLRTKIAQSISAALGRPVEISSASLRFLPQPGFDLQNFVVYDDPAFSLEPVLRSDEVTASLRLTSLLRGHLEIARLSLTDPSLNLVRNSTGHWNLEYLLGRASQISAAPTGKRSSETRPAFPYIEAGGGRINFKFGIEKMQFALTEADFALFQDSENSWGMRLQAKPVRTDSNFSDSGVLKVSATWQRASSLHETPLRANLQWQQAQLGQASKLFFGNDKGWRGEASISAELSGTPSNLALISQASIEDFRRYDIVAGRPIRLRGQCGANYSSTTQVLSNIICQAPVADGAISLHGTVSVSAHPSYHLSAFAQDVPIQSLIALAIHSKQNIPSDVIAAGTVNGTIKVTRDENAARTLDGSVDTSEFRLASQSGPSELSLPKIHCEISSNVVRGATGVVVRQRPQPDQTGGDADRFIEAGKRRRAPTISTSVSPETRANISPFSLPLGGALPATVHGWFSRSGYDFALEGEGQIRRVLRAAHAIGIPAPQSDADGAVKFELRLADLWAGFRAPRVTGEAELHSVHARVNGLNKMIEIEDAKMALDPHEVRIQGLTARFGNETWRGSLVVPRPCGILTECLMQVNLHADEIATDELGALFDLNKSPWYRFLMTQPKRSSTLMALRATGRLSADRVLIRKLQATRFSTSFSLNQGKLDLADVNAVVLGGAHVGTWKMDFTVKPPVYSGEGSFQHVALSQLANAMRDNWISGTSTATYRAAASGSSGDELLSSATATIQVEARDGVMPHLQPANFAGPLQIRRFLGSVTLRHKQFDFGESKLSSNDGVYVVSGSASLGRALNLKLTRTGNRGFNIGGTVNAPVITSTPIAETQAALKP